MIELLENISHLVSCDFCHRKVEVFDGVSMIEAQDNFDSVIDRIKTTGWRIKDEKHQCPICAGNEDLFGA